MQYNKVNILWMSKLNSAFVVIHMHADLIFWITHIKNNSKLRTYTPGHGKLWSISLRVYHCCHMVCARDQQIWVHCQLQIFAGAGMGLQERFRSLTRTVDRLPWLINHQLVTLRWLTQTKSKWPNGVLVFIGTVYRTVEMQPVKRSKPSHHLSTKTHEMFLYTMLHISFIHLLSIFFCLFLQR